MALPNEPLTRTEQYLNRTATGGGTIPDEPLTRIEQYLDHIAKNGGSGGGGSSGGGARYEVTEVDGTHYLETGLSASDLAGSVLIFSDAPGITGYATVLFAADYEGAIIICRYNFMTETNFTELYNPETGALLYKE